MLQASPLMKQGDWDEYKDHLMLTESDVEGKRVLILGDVHGCMGELFDMMEKVRLFDINFSNYTCYIWFTDPY